jgi:predicted nucleic acid-binding protein
MKKLGEGSNALLDATDILIAACALHHGAGIETSDSDFDALNSLRKFIASAISPE